MVDDAVDEKRMRLRYAGTCRVCGAALAAKVEAIYERGTRSVRCLHHVEPSVGADVDIAPPPVADAGTPGGSARREYERRRAKREARVRARFPKYGGLLLALTDDAQSTTAWKTGARGEEALGKGLNKLTPGGVRLLHDRRIPGSRANIDHIAVAATGIYVIDAKHYKGQPRPKVEGGLLSPRVEKLMVGGRDCSKLVDGVLKQVDAVRAIVGQDIPVQGVLCFVGADWPMIGGSFATRHVVAVWPRKLFTALVKEGPIALEDVERMHAALAAGLPPA